MQYLTLVSTSYHNDIQTGPPWTATGLPYTIHKSRRAGVLEDTNIKENYMTAIIPCDKGWGVINGYHAMPRNPVDQPAVYHPVMLTVQQLQLQVPDPQCDLLSLYNA